MLYIKFNKKHELAHAQKKIFYKVNMKTVFCEERVQSEEVETWCVVLYCILYCILYVPSLIAQIRGSNV